MRFFVVLNVGDGERPNRVNRMGEERIHADVLDDAGLNYERAGLSGKDLCSRPKRRGYAVNCRLFTFKTGNGVNVLAFSLRENLEEQALTHRQTSKICVDRSLSFCWEVMHPSS